MFKSRGIKLIILVVGIFFVIGFLRNIFHLLDSEKRVGEAEGEVEELLGEQEALLEKREYYQSEEFVEKQARDKLNMAKEGETVVILPEGEGVLGEVEISRERQEPIWKKWLGVFGF